MRDGIARHCLNFNSIFDAFTNNPVDSRASAESNHFGFHVQIQQVGDAAVSFGVLAVAPFIVMVVVGAPELSWSDVSAPTPEPHWGTFLNVLLWNTCGYDSAGTLAAEVAEPVRNYGSVDCIYSTISFSA